MDSLASGVFLLLVCSINLLPGLHCRAASAAETYPNVAAADQASAEATRVLKGKAAVVNFKLDNLRSYMAGRAALDRREFRRADILFKQAAAQLGEGYEKYRAECLYFRGRCLEMERRRDDAIDLYRAAAKLFDLHDSENQYRALAIEQISRLSGAKARSDKVGLQGGIATNSIRVSVDQNITLTGSVTNRATSDRFILRVDEKTVPKVVYNCFAEMTCLETAEIGSNVNNAVGRWQPLLVRNEPAAFTVGASAPSINVKLNGLFYDIELPRFSGMRRILLATDNEKICAFDIDSYDSWLLHIKRAKDGALQSYHWAKLTHVKDGVDSAMNSSMPTWNRSSKHKSNWGTSTKRSPSAIWESDKPRRFSKANSGQRARGDSGF